jgi:hypothetical protein
MRGLYWSLGLGAIAVLWAWSGREIAHPPGVLVKEAPEQSALETPVPPWPVDRYQLSALAKFHIRARVLGSERYRFDAGADLSPIDFALGWGAMSDSAVLKQLSIGQHSRFYFYSWSNTPPIPPGEIISSSSNMHLIPADDEVRSQLTSVRVGQLVEFSGYLVRAERADGWRWVSSLTRHDTGAGACELVWVESVEAE